MKYARLPALAVFLLILGLPTATFGSASQKAPQARYLVLVVLDGFRPDYMALAPMRHLHALMHSGMTYDHAWVGQLETETPTGHATIATGAYPAKHGVIGFVWKDPTGQNITWMPTNLQLLNAGDMENLIEAGGVPTLSDQLHLKYPHAISAALSGEKYYAADAMGAGANFVVYGDSFAKDQGQIVATAIGRHIPPPSAKLQNLSIHSAADPLTEDTWAGRLALRLAGTARPRMLLINLPGPDIQGHLSGGVTDRPAIRNVDVGVDAVLAEIMAQYRKLGIYKQTLFVVTADHGMIPNTHVINREEIYAAVRATSAPSLEDDLLSTAGYIFLSHTTDAKRVAGALAKKHFRYVEGAFYKVQTPTGYAFRAIPATARKLGPAVTQAYLDLCNTFASFTGPDVVLPYTEDTLGDTVKGYGPHWGTHGGLSWRVQHIPLVISGPGVRHGVSSFPAQLVDIAPTVERLMGLSIPRTVDGVVLGDALTQRSGADMSTERKVAGRRAADVNALKAHSIAQHGIALDNQ